MNSIIKKRQKRWVIIGLISLMIATVTMITTDCTSEITGVNNLYLGIVIIFISVAAFGAAVVNTIDWINRVKKQKDDNAE